jgi:hypothetical protein
MLIQLGLALAPALTCSLSGCSVNDNHAMRRPALNGHWSSHGRLVRAPSQNTLLTESCNLSGRAIAPTIAQSFELAVRCSPRGTLTFRLFFSKGQRHPSAQSPATCASYGARLTDRSARAHQK